MHSTFEPIPVDFCLDSTNDGIRFSIPIKEEPMATTLQKKVRVTPEQWTRLETEATERQTTPNRLLVDLAFEALERRNWPRTEAEIHLLRSALFAAQAIARDMIAAGREDDYEEITRSVTEIAPELPR